MTGNKDEKVHGINDVEEYLVRAVHVAITKSMKDGSEKYGDHWKEQDFDDLIGLVRAKFEMFIRLCKMNEQVEIDHHLSDMIVWMAMLAYRGRFAIDGVKIPQKTFHGKVVLKEILQAIKDGSKVVIYP